MQIKSIKQNCVIKTEECGNQLHTHLIFKTIKSSDTKVRLLYYFQRRHVVEYSKNVNGSL